MIRLKDNLLRLLRDKRILDMHPLRIENRVHQLAVKEYRRVMAGENLASEDKENRMIELSEKSYEAVTDAIDVLKDFSDYTPIKFLGSIVLYPSSLKGYITSVLSIFVLLVQEKYLAPL